MIDPSNCVRYTLDEAIDQVCHKIIAWLSMGYPEILLIHQETRVDHDRVSTQLTLIHRRWGPTVNIQIIPKDTKQSLILIAAPPDPGLEDVRPYETQILENLPASSASIRLALVDGNDERASFLIRTGLREQRHHCWMQIQAELIRSLHLKIYEGDLEELSWDIPTDNQDIDQGNYVPSQDESLVLDLWGKGHTAKQIALRMGRTEKTILNRLTLMRKTYGEQLVPRRRIA